MNVLLVVMGAVVLALLIARDTQLSFYRAYFEERQRLQGKNPREVLLKQFPEFRQRILMGLFHWRKQKERKEE